MIETAEMAKAAVQACQFPVPYNGTRGYGSPVTQHAWRLTGPEYFQAADNSLLVAVQIETKLGVANLKEICQVEDLGMYYFAKINTVPDLDLQTYSSSVPLISHWPWATSLRRQRFIQKLKKSFSK